MYKQTDNYSHHQATLNGRLKMYQTRFNAETNIWSGAELPLVFHPDVSIGRVILHSLYRDYNKIVQINDAEGTQLTGGEIKSRAIRCAIHMQARGIVYGDVIGLVTRNSTNLSPVVIAALLIGAPVNPLDPNFEADDISHVFGLTKPKLIFCDDDLVNEVRKALKMIGAEVTVVTMDGQVDGCERMEDYLRTTKKEHDFLPPVIANADKHAAFILCSSGTTGLSKGVMISHAQVLSKLTEVFDVKSDDIVLCFSSLYWLTGTGTLVLTSVMGATRLITTEKFTGDTMLRLTEKYRVTTIIAPPSQIGLMLQCPDIYLTDFSSVRVFNTGGSALPIVYQEKMQKLLTSGILACAYGMSELSGMAAYNQGGILGSVGSLAPSTQVKIIDEDENLLGIGQDGEICHKSQYTFLGYCGNPEATKSTLDAEGWLHSGDIGHFDTNGHLFLVDRKKDILKYRNYQISPSDLENIILKLNGISMVCVVGIPDPISTDLPAAVVVRSGKITADEIYNWVAERVGDYKKLRGGVYFVDELPMTPSGKVIRRNVLKMAIEAFNNTGADN